MKFFLGVSLLWCHAVGAQEAPKLSSSLPVDIQSRMMVSWAQVANGFERPRPFQTRTALGLAYRVSHRWIGAVNYDFATVTFEASEQFYERDRLQVGWTLGLVPELRSFSWQFGPWAGYNLARGRLLATIRYASINAWGEGLWASDLRASPKGRVAVFSTDVFYSLAIAPTFYVRAGLGARSSPNKVSGESILQNRFSFLVGLNKGFE